MRARPPLTVTFHHPEQSLLHKLHWLDHVIRVGVFSARTTQTLNTNTLSYSYLQLVNNEVGKRKCLVFMRVSVGSRATHTTNTNRLTSWYCMS